MNTEASSTPRTDAAIYHLDTFEDTDSGFIHPDFARTLELELEQAKNQAIPICIGQPLIEILAKEGSWQSEDGGAVIAADTLFHKNPYEQIHSLTTQLAQSNKEKQDYVERSDRWFKAIQKECDALKSQLADTAKERDGHREERRHIESLFPDSKARSDRTLYSDIKALQTKLTQANKERDEARKVIREALSIANGRWSEWGTRAEMVRVKLGSFVPTMQQ